MMKNELKKIIMANNTVMSRLTGNINLKNLPFHSIVTKKDFSDHRRHLCYLSGWKRYSGFLKSVSLNRRVRAETWGCRLGLYSSFSKPANKIRYTSTNLQNELEKSGGFAFCFLSYNIGFIHIQHLNFVQVRKLLQSPY